MNIEIVIENKGKFYQPIVQDGVTWATERVGVSGKLTFSILKDNIINFQEGNNVSLKINGQGLFNGFVFSKSRGKEEVISVTAYDQLRYLQNEDSANYENKTATDIIKMIAADFRLVTGELAQTSYSIPSLIEDGGKLFDIINTALSEEFFNRGDMYIFYDDYGKLTLKNLADMALDLLIDAETGETFDYATSIDEQTYNQIKVSYDNKETGKRDIYIAKDGQHINDWGVLQYTDTANDPVMAAAKAAGLLSLFNAKTRKLKINNVFGDWRVRGGSRPYIRLGLGDISLDNHMIVDKVTHKFNNDEHLMDLTLIGGEFSG